MVKRNCKTNSLQDHFKQTWLENIQNNSKTLNYRLFKDSSCKEGHKRPTNIYRPLFLHKVLPHIYYSFFTYIATEIKLDNLELRIPPDMYFGSDDEKAITNTIQDAFLSATRRLCSKHLKDNFNHYIQDKIRSDTKERQHLMKVVFGQDGLTNADTTLMFDERSTMVTEEMKEYPALCQYYDIK